MRGASWDGSAWYNGLLCRSMVSIFSTVFCVASANSLLTLSMKQCHLVLKAWYHRYSFLWHLQFLPTAYLVRQEGNAFSRVCPQKGTHAMMHWEVLQWCNRIDNTPTVWHWSPFKYPPHLKTSQEEKFTASFHLCCRRSMSQRYIIIYTRSHHLGMISILTVLDCRKVFTKDLQTLHYSSSSDCFISLWLTDVLSLFTNIRITC